MSSQPASVTAEQDARQIHAHDHVSPGDIAIGVIIGRTSEFFDFFVYAIASVIVFPQTIFSFADPLTATLWSFGIFALAFIARPFGTMIFTAIDRTYGKGAKLTLALLLLGTSTVLMGLLPQYETVGAWAVVMLAALRIGQGLALGGAWDGLASLLALNAPRNKTGVYAMVPQLGAPLGLLVAALLFVFLVSSLSAQDFLDWGWRYPFFVAFAINVVALFARLRIVVTSEYERLFLSRELQPTSFRETIAKEGSTIIAGAFVPLASFALFHMVTVFPLSWVYLYTDEAPANFLLIEAIGACFGLVAVYLSGKISDAIGRRTLLMLGAIAIGIFALVAPLLLSGDTLGELTYMIVGFILLGLSFGQCSGAAASVFAPGYRYVGSAIVSDLAWLFGAGFAPLAALVLSSYFGLVWGGIYLLSGAICTVLALRFVKVLEFRAN
ncbi:MFS transporter [Frigidibacter sp. MR17.24]|uniref:MFS transporter n=1 Tax=Frigidibacter sp. MR17.24 TaxID=3127345 RepID=UPI003012E721